MDLDILSALEATPVPDGSTGCPIGRFLAEIPEATPGRDQLVAMLSEPSPGRPGWRRIEDIVSILRRLGMATSNGTVGVHRLQMCRCYR